MCCPGVLFGQRIGHLGLKNNPDRVHSDGKSQDLQLAGGCQTDTARVEAINLSGFGQGIVDRANELFKKV